MIKARVVKTVEGLSAIYPKVYIPDGDYDESIFIPDATALVGLPAGGFFIEPLTNWEEGTVLVGSAADTSFVIVSPPATTEPVSIA